MSNRWRAAYNRGRRHELWVRKKLADVGFDACRVNEISGFTTGFDIALRVYVKVLHCWSWVFVRTAIQCKSTRTKADLRRGLNEARRGWPGAHLFVCIHRYHIPNKKPQLRIAASTSNKANGAYQLLNWDELVERLVGLLPTSQTPAHVFDETQTRLRNERTARLE
jgi:hypothetical protein